ncbi:MAG: ABC-type transport system involved in multi-copper enzyme maturation permease subunit [Phycisphaerales bacterium]
MTFRERLSAANRLQQTRGFKVFATIVVTALTIAALGTWLVLATSQPAVPGIDIPEGMDAELARELTAQYQLFANLAGSSDPVAARIAMAVSGLLASLVVIWLGLGLTYLGLGVAAAGVAGPMLLYGPTSGAGRMLGGVVLLTMAFTALMQAMRLVLGGSRPVAAIAQNVLAEAVRLKLSLIFVVMLIVLMAALPLVLDPEQPLRYRVQTFLQWATGGGFWIIATMVVFFSVGTVAFEQRDKVIWQTMTKPVAAWEYLLGKWLGVSCLAAIMLAVSSSGVFLFTEYLRNQPAEGEIAGQIDPMNLTEDRIVLESQVLTARKSVNPRDIIDYNDEGVDVAVRDRIEAERLQDPGYDPTPAEMYRMRLEVLGEQSLEYRSIDPREEQFEEFIFYGLGKAKASTRPITLRYKINAEGNRPDEMYTLYFESPIGPITQMPGRRTGLGFSHTLTLSPEFIDDNGELVLRVWNGSLSVDEQGRPIFMPNPGTITFPTDGLEVSYAAGSYRLNFVRIVFVLWVKLAFLAALGVWAGSFLSFPVAGLVSIGTFLVAEGASFVSSSIDQYRVKDLQGNVEQWRIMIRGVAQFVSDRFLVYSELRPTTRLADGRLLSWAEVAGGTTVLLVAMLVLFVTGVMIFRKRELAIYSGH